MNKQQSIILMIVTAATVAGAYGAVKSGKSIAKVVAGGFVVALFLLAFAESDKAAPVAEMFAVAFAVTALAENGTGLLNAVSGAVGKPAAPAPTTVTATGGGTAMRVT